MRCGTAAESLTGGTAQLPVWDIGLAVLSPPGYPVFMFGARLRELRKARGLKQVVLAEMAGVRPHTLWRYEADQTFPSGRALQRLAEALDVTMEELLAEQPSDQTGQVS